MPSPSKLTISSWIVAACLIFLPSNNSDARNSPIKTISRIAFGSCLDQVPPQRVWEEVLRSNPDIFIFLGDNIYSDTEDMAVLRENYNRLSAIPNFQKLRESPVEILATWDNHDYGGLNSGYPYREASEKIFLDFFEEPPDSNRRKRPGVYDSYMFGKPGRRVQIILLDVRYFKSDVIATHRSIYHGRKKEWLKKSTMLGEDQWKWLKRQLKKPADIRIIGSGSQFISENDVDVQSGLWSLMPHERKRLFDLFKRTNAEGIVLISGDRHFSEISRLDDAIDYPLYEFTSSGLSDRKIVTPNGHNIYRVGDLFSGPGHFGLITIDWKLKNPSISFEIRDKNSQTALHHKIFLSLLRRQK